MFGFSERKGVPPVDRSRALCGVPLLNPGVRVEESPPGRITVTIARRRGSGWLAAFQPAIMERRLRLDEIGSFVLRLIDGRRSVRDIIGILEREHRVNRREAELSCVEFMRTLLRRHVISIAID